MPINLLLIISSISKVVFFEWMAESLNPDEFNLTFVIMNDQPAEVQKALEAKGQRVYHIPYKNKLDLPAAIVRLSRIIRREKISSVHAHLLDASLAGMVAAKISRVKKRIFTRHYSNYHHVYNRKGIWYDRLCNSLATDIVAITDIVKEYLLLEGADSRKIAVIHHGFKLSDYSECTSARIDTFRGKYDLDPTKIVVGVVSRYTRWKGVQFIIPAFKDFLVKHPDAILLLANAKGNDEKYIKGLLAGLPTRNVREIVYENDMAALYHSLTLFVHVPIDRDSEAFGQVYIEVMAAGIPSVITLSGIVNDFVIKDIHAAVVPFQDDSTIKEAMEKIIDDPDYSNRIKINGKGIVEELFSLDVMMNKLKKLYHSN